MIPILYSKNETTYTTNGLGRLSDALTCNVVEERNGKFELSMEYPVEGVHFGELETSAVISAVPADGKRRQPFRIYKIEKLINGKVRIYAEHNTYRARHIPVMPFEANSCVSAMAGLSTNAIGTNPFTLWTDISKAGKYAQDVPESIRARLGGQKGSILDVYGGELEWDENVIKLHARRGHDSGVTLRYGKNITDLTQEKNITNTYTAVCPYYRASSDDECLTLPEGYIASDNAGNFPFIMAKAVDMSGEFDDGTTVTVEALREKTREYIEKNNIGVPAVSIKVSFVALWQTEEYKNIAALERVNLCDTVTVVFEKLGVSATAKVIRTNYNVLKDRYDSIELGESKTQLSGMVASQNSDIEAEFTSHMQQAIAHATKLIQGGLGGYIVMTPNPDTGYPEEILIMNKPDKTQATRVIRMNLNGIGFSDNGYNGPFVTAWTIAPGSTTHFVADFIDAGVFNADLIQAGRIQPIIDGHGTKSANYWDMVTGDFQLSGAKVGNYAVASSKDVSDAKSAAISTAGTNTASAITQYDNALNQLKVFNKLTNNGTLEGIFMRDGKLYINASYVSTGILASPNSKFALNMSNGHVSMKDGEFSGTITGATIQNAADNDQHNIARILMDSSASIKGYYGNKRHNIINMEQVVSGKHQMTFDADTQMNIRTPILGVEKGTHGDSASEVDITECGEYQVLEDIRKWMYGDSVLNPEFVGDITELWVKDVGQDQGDIYCTLPVYLKVTYRKAKRVHGMTVTGSTTEAYAR